jgi:hypothetical protein
MAFKTGLGIQVDRGAQNIAITVTPGLPLFTIAGGLVLIKAIVGVCTTTFGAAATNMYLCLNPTVGDDTDLSLTVDIGTATVLGDVVGFVGAPGSSLVGGHPASAQILGVTQGFGLVCMAGVIGLVSDAANGAMRWTLWYMPVDAGATIVAA